MSAFSRLLLLVVVGTTSGAAACGERPGAEPPPGSSTSTSSHAIERAHKTMGTELRLTAWTTDDAAAISAFDAVFREFDRLDALMSVWLPGSDVLRLNDAAGDHP